MTAGFILKNGKYFTHQKLHVHLVFTKKEQSSLEEKKATNKQTVLSHTEKNIITGEHGITHKHHAGLGRTLLMPTDGYDPSQTSLLF